MYHKTVKEISEALDFNLLGKEDIVPKNIVIGNVNDIKSILDSDNILFVEEYGITRYKNFEENLQVIKNLNKNVLGVATYGL